ncbi:MAG: DUF998 domain-containing protein [Calditrichaeota bacterium]|nr:MAG: DUF998 domain-containing protein [Calditrichota bacterium]
MAKAARKQKDLVFSYLEHRKVIGILGITLPFIVSIGASLFFSNNLQNSISSYYHTGMRDVFVGILFVIGFFLLAYRGHERADDIAGDLACLFAIGVALFPTTGGKLSQATEMTGYIHLAFAAAFFITLAYFSLKLFTKTNPDKTPTKKKFQRNKVYKTCGWTIIGCIVIMAVLSFLPAGTKASLESLRPVFWLEAIAIIAFGISWFTKGEGILKDLD